MSCDDDDAGEDASGFRQPPHPDDRLWRHPSEMDDHPIAPIGEPGGSAPSHARDHGHPWLVRAGTALGVLVVVAGLAAVLVGSMGVDGGGGDRGSGRAGSADQSTAGGTGVTGDTGDRDLAAAVAAVMPSVVGLEGGSGVIVSAEGVVLTSASLATGAGPLRVRLPNGVTVDADVVGVDPTTGLGVLDLPGDGYAPAGLAEPGDEAGEDGARTTGPVYTVGASDGSEEAQAAAGAVGTSHKLDGAGGSDLDGVLGVTGDTAGPGALGGPVVDAQGAVIGVTTALGGERTSYLTPIDVGEKVAADLVETGRVRHSWLGIEGTDHVEGSGLHASVGHGAEVARVAAGGPAAAAGVRPDDVIVALDGRPVDRMSDLIRWLRALSPGDEAEITFERGGESGTTTVVLGERPA